MLPWVGAAIAPHLPTACDCQALHCSNIVLLPSVQSSQQLHGACMILLPLCLGSVQLICWKPAQVCRPALRHE